MHKAFFKRKKTGAGESFRGRECNRETILREQLKYKLAVSYGMCLYIRWLCNWETLARATQKSERKEKKKYNSNIKTNCKEYRTNERKKMNRGKMMEN